MKREYRLFIEDMLESIEMIEDFVDDMTFDEFVKDDKTLNAVIRKLEIVGEAAKNVPAEVKKQHKELPWSEMAGMRDKMAHAYFGINYKIVWKVIKERLPEVKPAVRRILKEMNDNV